MIIDCHAHIFPYQGGASGFDSPETHLLYWQQAIAGNPATAVHRAKDGSVAEDHALWQMWDPDSPGLEGAYDVDFRVGRFGRFEWTKKGIDYYVHVFPPTLQNMTASPEFMMAQMDWAGVDMAVLQNAWIYGQLNDYFAEAVKRYRRRFLGQVQVKETELDRVAQIEALRHAVVDLGLSGGIYYADVRLSETDHRDHIDDDKAFPFWEEVQGLGIVVSWSLSAVPDPMKPGRSRAERYVDQLARLNRLLDRFPEIPSVLVHGLPLTVFGTGDAVVVPQEVWDIWSRPRLHLEILFPIQTSYPRPGASRWDYPYPQARPIIKELYTRLGPEKLLWGSDMPNVERNCTYKQCLDYLARYCDFIPPHHLDLIIGGNAARLLNLDF